MRGRLRLRQLTLLALVVFSIVGLTAGCTSTPHREIEAIGVLASAHSAFDGPDTVDTFTFDDGRTFTLRYTGYVAVGYGARVGDLLIAGTHPDNWVLVAPPEPSGPVFPPGCFGLGSHAGWERDTTVELDFGVTLQKAPDYDPVGHKALAHFDGLGVICLDRQGRVKLIN